MFFFKQKTAYEMRISDWSSDVCSSDLEHRVIAAASLGDIVQQHRDILRAPRSDPVDQAGRAGMILLQLALLDSVQEPDGADRVLVDGVVMIRSEEHTSELQSLMRISYAVFCLTKKQEHNKREKSRQ